VSVLMLDSNRDSLGKDEGWRKETTWLQEELSKPQAEKTWRIAVAHHPLFSNGQHGDNGVLQTTWGSSSSNTGWTCTFAATITTCSIWK
jgi:3',5'-cyclic AMP phosphodiesterase CpdA